MKVISIAIVLFAACASIAYGAEKGLHIDMVDNRISMSAEDIPLSWLLHVLDEATGMKSTVPDELASRIISVRFSGLTADEAVEKIFEGQPFDYAFIERQGIIVTALSKTITAADLAAAASAAASNVPTPQQSIQSQAGPPMNRPEAETMKAVPTPGGAQPATIQTPFGPISTPNNNSTNSQQNGASSGTLGSPIPSFNSGGSNVPGQRNP
jgi:hypothetical protein